MLQEDFKKGQVFCTLFEIRWELTVVLNTLAESHERHWARMPRDILLEKLRQVSLLTCLWSQSCWQELWPKSGSVSETFSLSTQFTATYTYRRITEHTTQRKEKLQKVEKQNIVQSLRLKYQIFSIKLTIDPLL